jgi:hypothetical protein
MWRTPLAASECSVAFSCIQSNEAAQVPLGSSDITGSPQHVRSIAPTGRVAGGAAYGERDHYVLMFRRRCHATPPGKGPADRESAGGFLDSNQSCP